MENNYGNQIMFQSFLLIVLLTLNLFATQAPYKIKAKQYGDIVKVKARIVNPMLNEILAKKKNTEADYLVHIVAKVGGHIVYDAKIGASWSQNPIFKFSYRYVGHGDKITIKATDNKGKITTGKALIKKSSFKGKADKGISIETPRHTAVQKKVNLNDRSAKTITGKIHITVPKVSSNPSAIPVKIKTDLPLVSMQVYSDGNIDPLVADFSITQNTPIDYSFKMRSFQPCAILVVMGEGKDGKLYRDSVTLSTGYNCEKYKLINCDDLAGNLDKRICSDLNLAFLERQLTTYYEKLIRKKYLRVSRKVLIGQEKWKADRKKYCPALGTECLKQYYQNRIDQLQDIYEEKSIPMQFPDKSCGSFGDIDFSSNIQIFAGGSYGGKNIKYQIDKSGHSSTIFDVTVNSPDKPVGLILGSYGPSVWHIHRTKGTKIEGVVAYGLLRQVVAGLPKNTPILDGSNGKKCDKYNDFGLYFNKPRDAFFQKRINQKSQQLFDRNITEIYRAKRGDLTLGKPIHPDVKLYSSTETTPESFADQSELPAGKAGLQVLIKKGKIRKLTKADKERWAQKKLAYYKAQVKASGEKLSSMSLKGKYNAFLPKYIMDGFMILDKITIPKGSRATFFVPEGATYPKIAWNDRPAIFEFDTLTCNSQLGCGNLLPFQKKIVKKRSSNPHCQFKNASLPENLTIIAINGGDRKLSGHAIDKSGYEAVEHDIIINMPNKPIALLLSNREPTIWNIKWTAGTQIKSVFATGRYRQVVVGLPKTTALASSVHADKDYDCYLSDASCRRVDIIDRFSWKVYSKDIAQCYEVNKKGKVTIGDPISTSTTLHTSTDIPASTFYTDKKPSAGKAGIEYLLKQGKIRYTTKADLDLWALKRYRRFLHSPEARKPIINTNTAAKTVESFKLKMFLHTVYVILEKITIPPGSSADWFVPENIPYPDGSIKNRSTVYNFNTLTCKGLMFCK